jgi:hypothetical protein
MMIVFLFSAIINISLSIVIYARIIEDISTIDEKPWQDLLSNNCLNYVATSGLIILPVIPFKMYLSNLETSLPKMPDIIIGVIINALMIYVMPFVFLTKKIFSSIQAGLLFLYKNWYSSLPLVLVVIVIGLIKITTLLLIAKYWVSSDLALPSEINRNLLTVFSFGFIQNIFSSYLDLLLFSWASLRISLRR